MTIRYIQQTITMTITISANDIDADDMVNIYETTVDPSSPVLLSVLNGVFTSETNPNPSAAYLVCDPSYLNPSACDLITPEETISNYEFSYTKKVSDSKNYSFYYTVKDVAGNESGIIESFDIDVCLTPRAPDSLVLSELDFII